MGVYGLFLAVAIVARAATVETIVVHSIISCYNDVSSRVVDSHASYGTAILVQRSSRLTLAFAGDNEGEDTGRSGNVQGSRITLSELYAGDWLFGFKDGALLCATIMHEIAANDSDGAVGKADGKLTQVI